MALAALWGASFLFIRVAAPAMGPVILVEVRVILAGAALLVYGVAMHSRLDLRRRWLTYLLLGVFNAALPYTLISAAELRLSAGLAAILNATTPLFTAIVAVFWLGDAFTWRKAAGLLVGIAGVVVVMGGGPLPLDGPTLLAAGASLLGALSYGVAGVYARRALVGVAPLASATGQQLGAAVALAPLAIPIVATQRAHITPTPGAVWATLALALLCTSLAYLLFFHLISAVGPISTLSVTFLVPVFGLVWSALFLHERLTIGAVVGLAIILGSMWLVTGMRLPARLTTRGKRALPSTGAATMGDEPNARKVGAR